MSRSEFSAPRVPEVHDESIATTLKVIMDVLKVSRLISLLCLCCFVASNSIIISTPFENVVILDPLLFFVVVVNFVLWKRLSQQLK